MLRNSRVSRNISRNAEGPVQGIARWKAVQARDRRADGAFVYAVRSTGIYCRPSCPSRKPAREQVVFFPLPEAAEQQGFRACRRCRPRTAPLRDPKIETVARVCREIDARVFADAGADENDDARLTLAALSSPVGMSPHQLERAFRAAMGITPRQYADAQRMRRLKSRLKKGDNVTTALYDAGFGSSSRLYERAPGHLGMTPAEYGRGGDRMKIHYVIVGSPLGRLLVEQPGGASARSTSASPTPHSAPRFARNTRAPSCCRTATEAKGRASASGSSRFSRTCAVASRILICRQTSRPPHSSGASGKNSAAFPTAPRGRTPRSPALSDALPQFALSPAPVPRIPFPWWCLAIAWCVKTGISPDTAGESTASARCSKGKRPPNRKRASRK